MERDTSFRCVTTQSYRTSTLILWVLSICWTEKDPAPKAAKANTRCGCKRTRAIKPCSFHEVGVICTSLLQGLGQ